MIDRPEPIRVEDWPVVESLFDQALELEAEDRLDWIMTLDVPAAIRAQLRTLLRAHVASSDRFEHPIIDLAAEAVTESIPDPMLGTRLGAFTVAEEIGRGGMGVAYRATRSDGNFDQEVAIKILRVGLDDEIVRHRFEQERQILADLDHPGIARLLDGGVTPDGRPYIVMEWVDGTRIDTYCDRKPLDVQSRVRLFLQVVDAVHAAHTHLVIHRDLKPSNVLVREDGQVRLLDFGIARVLDSEHESGATRTLLGSMTPEYASPEQVRGERTTTASDVYQLGLLLFRLLTGRLPYALDSDSPLELARAICEKEPLPPSRCAPDRAIARALRGDLDHILLRALEKTPSARYDTARALGDDLQRHLDGLPVHASGKSPLYRARKFVRRNRAGLITAAAMVLLATAALIGHTHRIRSERDQARLEATRRQEVSDFLVQLLKITDPQQHAGEDVRARDLVRAAATRLAADVHDPEVRAHLLPVLGAVAQNLGLSEEARDALQAQYDLQEDLHGPVSLELAEAAMALSGYWRRAQDPSRALPYARRALEIRQRLLSENDVRTAFAHQELGRVAIALGDLDLAEKELRRSYDVAARDLDPDDLRLLGWRNDFAQVLRRQQRYGEAERLYRETLAQLERQALPDSGQIAMTLNNLAFTLKRAGRNSEAIDVYRKALRANVRSVGALDRRTQICRGNLAAALTEAGRWDEAIEVSRTYQSIETQISGEDHWRTGSAGLSLGRILLLAGKFEEAERAVERAQAILVRALGADHSWVAVSRAYLGAIRLASGDETGGQLLTEEAFQRLEAEENANCTGWMVGLAQVYDLLERPGLASRARALD